MFVIPDIGLRESDKSISSNGMVTIVNGYQNLNLGLFVQNNDTKNIVASGFSNDFVGKMLTVTTSDTGEASSDMNVTSYLHFTYNKEDGTPVSGVVKRTQLFNSVSDPEVIHPTRRSKNPNNPRAINIGIGRGWSDQGENSKFDYAWNEATQDHPIGRIPFVGSVEFEDEITPLNPEKNFFLNIYVADITEGGAAKIDVSDLGHVCSCFKIDDDNPKKLVWDLSPGTSTKDKGNPIIFGNVTWSSDIEAYFYCGMTVSLKDGIGCAAVQSKSSEDIGKDPQAGLTEIMPIDFIWHCLAEDTAIRMADGELKPIQQIIAGDKVVFNGSSESTNVLWTNKGAHKGKVSKLIDELGNEIISSHNHIFITKKGAVKANELIVGDDILTDNGISKIASVNHDYEYNGMMYNLAVADYQRAEDFNGLISTFTANGFIVGDINAQRHIAYQQRNDVAWLKEQLPKYLHQDIETHFKEQLAKRSSTN